MQLLQKIFYTRRPRRAAHALYSAAVTAARQPEHYLQGGVPDTVDGRFDLIVLYLHLTVERLRQGGADAKLEDALVEVFFADMDRSLREMGVGDTGVGRRVRAMAEAFFGRAQAYGEALAAYDRGEGLGGLHAALERNLYRGQSNPAATGWMAERVVAVRLSLTGCMVDRLAAGDWPQTPGTEAGAEGRP